METTRKCQADGCSRTWKTRKLCNMHYQRLMAHGSTELPTRVEPGCLVEDCHEPHRGLGFCNKHYRRYKNHGSTESNPKGKKPQDPWDRIVALSKASESGCIIYGGRLDAKGYGSIRIGSRTDGSRRSTRTHRVAWEHFHGRIKNGLHVRHKCDNRACVNVEHLELGTHQDNMDDKARRGRARKALTEKDVHDIRAAAAAGEPVSKIHERYKTAKSTIYDVIARRSHRWT